jgi:hypothetical protein
VEEAVAERAQGPSPRLEEEMEWVAPWRVVGLAPVSVEGSGVRVPRNVVEETGWLQLLEERVAVVMVVDDPLLLIEKIQYGDGFSLDEFRRGF